MAELSQQSYMNFIRGLNNVLRPRKVLFHPFVSVKISSKYVTSGFTVSEHPALRAAFR